MTSRPGSDEQRLNLSGVGVFASVIGILVLIAAIPMFAKRGSAPPPPGPWEACGPSTVRHAATINQAPADVRRQVTGPADIGKDFNAGDVMRAGLPGSGLREVTERRDGAWLVVIQHGGFVTRFERFLFVRGPNRRYEKVAVPDGAEACSWTPAE